MKVSDYIFSFLREKGLKSVFYVPGGGNMFLVDALAQCDGIKGVPMHHEQACAMAAEAYSRTASCPGVALVTSGPGSTNAITGVGEAYTESIPMIVISGQVKRADLKGDSGLRQKGAQEVDIEKIASDLIKFIVTVREPREILHYLEKAYRIANEGRPGPVWLDVPLDVQASEIDPATLEGEQAQTCAPPVIGVEIEHVAKLIKESKRPVLMAGHGVRLAGAKDEFVSLVNQLGIPVVTTWIASDLLPHAHPLVVGRPGAVGLRAGNFAAPKIAEAVGISALEIRSRGELAPGIAEVLAANGPIICEIFTTRFEALLPKAMAIPQADGTMLSMPIEDMTPLLPRDILRNEMLVPLTEESEKVIV